MRQNAGVGSSVHGFVSDDAAFDARRTAPMKPPPRFVVWRYRVARSRRSWTHRRTTRSLNGGVFTTRDAPTVSAVYYGRARPRI